MRLNTLASAWVLGTLLIGMSSFGIITSCNSSSAASPDNQQTLWEALENNPDYSIFVEALKRTGWDDEVKKGNLTVFAPTNMGFQLMKVFKVEDLNIIPDEILKGIIASHLVSGPKSTVALKEAKKVIALNNKPVKIVELGGFTIAENATIEEGDINYKDGFFHKINNIISLENPEMALCPASNSCHPGSFAWPGCAAKRCCDCGFVCCRHQ